MIGNAPMEAYAGQRVMFNSLPSRQEPGHVTRLLLLSLESCQRHEASLKLRSGLPGLPVVIVYRSHPAMDPGIEQILAESRSHEKAGKISLAFQLAEQALELARAAGDAEGICGGLTHVANVHWRLGHYEEASRLAAEALRHAGRIPDSVTALHLLGLCAAETGELAQAEELFHRAADLSRQIDYRLGLSLALNNLAMLVYSLRGQFELALAAAKESFQINAEIGYPNWGYPLLKASLYQEMGNRGQAHAALAELKTIASPGSLVEGAYCIYAARLALDEDDLARAGDLLHRGRTVTEALGNPTLNLGLQITFVRWHLAKGEPSAARDWAEEAMVHARRLNSSIFSGLALIERARAAWAAGDLLTTERDLSQAIELMERLGSAYDLARATFFLAALLQQQGRPEVEATWLEAAGRIIRGGYAFLLQRERGLAFPLIATHLRSRNVETRLASEKLLNELAQVAPLPLTVVGLGRFLVSQGRRRIPDDVWARRKAGELFRFLLLQPNRAASRDVLLERFWPGHPVDAANDLFRQATSALRRILEPDLPAKFPSRYLTVEAERVALHLPPGSTLDFEAFERQLRAALVDGSVEVLSTALALYQGELFPLDRYSDWAAGRRERLERLYLRGLLALAAAQLAAGDVSASLEGSRQLLAHDPWHEDAALLGMRACLALNDRPGALRLYRQLERTLREELGITPRPDLLELANALRRGS